MSDVVGATIVKSTVAALPAAPVPAGPSRALQHMPAALMMIISVMVAGIGAALVLCAAIPDKQLQVLTNALTLLLGALITMANFYFGSSKSSQAKDDTIAKQLGA